jgi:hypothetical protein
MISDERVEPRRAKGGEHVAKGKSMQKEKKKPKQKKK